MMDGPIDSVITVEKHDKSRDETVDLTNRVGINRPQPMSSYTKVYHTDQYQDWLAGPPKEMAPYFELSVEWGILGKTVRRSEVVKAETWGDHEVRFVAYWYVHYRIQVPKGILGG